MQQERIACHAELFSAWHSLRKRVLSLRRSAVIALPARLGGGCREFVARAALAPHPHHASAHRGDGVLACV